MDVAKLFDQLGCGLDDRDTCAAALGTRATVKTQALPGDVVAVLSNGGFGGIHDKLLAALAD
jgi:UDP-N-acetylmuramate-alanine ligase